jgi:hypothetical protein
MLIDVVADVLLKAAVNELRTDDLVFSKKEKDHTYGDPDQREHTTCIGVTHLRELISRAKRRAMTT